MDGIKQQRDLQISRFNNDDIQNLGRQIIDLEETLRKDRGSLSRAEAGILVNLDSYESPQKMDTPMQLLRKLKPI